jgi:hypothetical protein
MVPSGPMVGPASTSQRLALGPRRSGETYLSADLTFLDQVSIIALARILTPDDCIDQPFVLAQQRIQAYRAASLGAGKTARPF